MGEEAKAHRGTQHRTRATLSCGVSLRGKGDQTSTTRMDTSQIIGGWKEDTEAAKQIKAAGEPESMLSLG